MIKAGTLGYVSIDTETHESYITKSTHISSSWARYEAHFVKTKITVMTILGFVYCTPGYILHIRRLFDSPSPAHICFPSAVSENNSVSGVTLFVKVSGRDRSLKTIKSLHISISPCGNYHSYIRQIIIYSGRHYVTSCSVYLNVVSVARFDWKVFNALRPRQNLPSFRRRHFQMHFREWKCMNFA